MKNKRLKVIIILLVVVSCLYTIYAQFNYRDFENSIRWENMRDIISIDTISDVTISGYKFKLNTQNMEQIVTYIKKCEFSSPPKKEGVSDGYSITLFLSGGGTYNFDYQGNGLYSTFVEGYQIYLLNKKLEAYIQELSKISSKK